MPFRKRSLLGHHFIECTSIGGKSYTPQNIGTFLSDFRLYNFLRFLGKYSYYLEYNNRGFKEYRDNKDRRILIAQPILPYLAMRAIETGNDLGTIISIDESHLATASDMFHGLDTPESYSQLIPEIAIQIAGSQFEYQLRQQHLLARTLFLYGDLWKKTPKANAILNHKELQRKGFPDIDLHSYLLLGFALTAQAKNGFVTGYNNQKQIEELSAHFDLTEVKQTAFFNKLSISYKEFRSKARKEFSSMPKIAGLPDMRYDRFRMNPILETPFIIPDAKLGSLQPYLTPIPALILNKITRGLYFDLSTIFREKRSNIFRDAFGHVLEEYVGILLNNSLDTRSFQILRGDDIIAHGVKKPDWIVLYGNTCVLIEVKETGLNKNARILGDEKEMIKSLSKIKDGVVQLSEFEQAIDTTESLKFLKHYPLRERMIVTYTDDYMKNTLLQSAIYDMFVAETDNNRRPPQYHLITLDELEFLLSVPNLHLFRLLNSKKRNRDTAPMDMGDYLAMRPDAGRLNNRFLDEKYHNFFMPIEAIAQRHSVSKQHS